VSQQKPKNTTWSKYGYLWATLALFLASLAGHWIFGWYAFIAEQAEHGQSPDVRGLCRSNHARHARELAIGVFAADLASDRLTLPVPRRFPVIEGWQRPARRKG
jgi:hypothetical protein